MATGSLGSLTVDLAANITRFERSLTRAEMIANKRAKGIERQVRRLAAGVAAAIASFGFVKVVEDTLGFADAIGKAADRAGVSTQKLQELRFAADQFGISTKQMDDGLRRFTRRLGVALDGGSFAKDFEALGVAIRDSSGAIRSSEDVLDDVVVKMGQLESQAQKSKVAAQLFGDDAGPQLALLLGQGAGRVEELTRKAHDLGLVIDDALIRKAEQAKDNMSIFSQVLRTQVATSVLELAPHITELSQQLTNLATGDLEQLPDSLKVLAFTAYSSAVGVEQVLKSLGALGAAATLLLQGDFKSIATVFEKFNADSVAAEESLQQFANRLVGLQEQINTGGLSPTAANDERGSANFLTGMTSDQMQQQIDEIMWLQTVWTDYEKQQAAERMKAEAEVAQFRQQTQQSSISNAIGLLRIFGRESKGAALTALAVEKGLAIATAIAGTQAAMAKSRIIDPSGALATKIAAEGALNVATIAALGLAQASQINKSFSGGGGGAAPGSVANPYAVEEIGAPGGGTVKPQGSVTINVNGVITESVMNDLVIPAIQDAVNDNDVLLFNNTSRQAQEIIA